MGCCLGTATANANHRRPPPEPSKLKPKPKPPSTSLSPPPPPAFEEETVKEVLSETPIVPKPPPPPTPPPPAVLRPETLPPAVDSTKTLTEEITENDSEMFSYSESFSAATTATVADKMDDDGEVNQKVNNKSPPPPAKRVLRKRPAVSSVEVGGRKDRAVRPARRQNVPSPEKKSQFTARSTAVNGQIRRNVGPASDSRREASARRSRSPAVRGEAGQRRKVRERSPVEKSGEVLTPVAKVVESEGKVTAQTAEDGGASPEMQTSESLENPLVSLECFIFL